MKEQIINNWDEIMEFLRTQFGISNVSYKTWLKNLRCKDITGNRIILSVDDPDIDKDNIPFITKRYGKFIKNAIEEVIESELEFDIQIINELPSAPSKSPALSGETRPIPQNLGLRLNSDYTFDNFVVSANNSFCHAASLKVAEAPGEYYNPLYIYGDPGLGKTHLMQSIAHFILENSPSLKVMYVNSTDFMNELIDAIRQGKNTMPDFRDKYRNIDVLLIDDIQFIIGKETTQEEFFHTFNYLCDAKKQVVISSDKPPRDFNDLDMRLLSRFEHGLTVDLTAPNFEAKMAILKKKLEMKQSVSPSGIDINDEVLTYIAENITTNIRSLEGALTKVIAMSKMKRIPIDIELAKESLRDIISPNQKRIVTPTFIINVVAEHYGLRVEELLSNKRDKYLSVPRQIAMYLSRKYTSQSTNELAVVFGRDHSTILHGITAIDTKRENNSELEKAINIITKKLNVE